MKTISAGHHALPNSGICVLDSTIEALPIEREAFAACIAGVIRFYTFRRRFYAAERSSNAAALTFWPDCLRSFPLTLIYA